MVQSDPFPEIPPGFVFGAATGPLQVEGEHLNDWRDFLARDGSKPDNGPNHWRRYRFDFRSLARINLKAYRLGFDWGRLQREPRGEFDREVVLRYLEMLAELRGHGIEPYLSLFNFACPQWLARRGGWLCEDAPGLFADFADRLAVATDGEVMHWITVHEPMLYALMAYVMGEFPPRCRGSRRQCLRALANLQRGHRLACAAIKSHYPRAQVGFSKHAMHFARSRSWSPLDRAATLAADRLFNRWGLERFALCPELEGGRVDFIFINLHGSRKLRGLRDLSPITGFSSEVLAEADTEQTDERYGRWLHAYLRRVQARAGIPIHIAARGPHHAGQEEDDGSAHILTCLRHCLRAREQGVDLRSFFYYPLLDSFDWRYGLARRQGLLAVDFSDPHRRRELRPLARTLARLAQRP